MASIDVDNAAKLVGIKVADMLKEKTGVTVLVTRDPSHCVDLCSKDLAQTDVVRLVMGDAKEVRDFVKNDRIDSIRLEMDMEGELEDTTSAIGFSETRM